MAVSAGVTSMWHQGHYTTHGVTLSTTEASPGEKVITLDRYGATPTSAKTKIHSADYS